MLTQLSTIKSRLNILDTDTTHDALLTKHIEAISARFDRECNRTFARTVDATAEFDGADTELSLPCYPIEAVSKFELKTNENENWLEQTVTDYLIRSQCVISLSSPIGYLPSSTSLALARVTYTGGYVLPGAPAPDYQPSTNTYPPVRLPADLEQAAIEQLAYWFRTREQTGLVRTWPHDGTYEQFAQADLLVEVKAVLKRYERWLL